VRNDGHDGTDALRNTQENGNAMNAHAGVLVLPERLTREAITSDLSVIAAQLSEAACRSRNGDREAARERISPAVSLFHGKRGLEPYVAGGPSNVCDAAADVYSDDGYDLLIKCLRTGVVHRLRMIFVDGGPQISPLLESFYQAPTYRSLSRRQAGILQMIARGMSNKCIARSLGITPETVKTHVKSILSKLEARTRAQAVAHAEANGLL
jgi:DNA-binding CsgD family transcriptional regulator